MKELPLLFILYIWLEDPKSMNIFTLYNLRFHIEWLYIVLTTSVVIIQSRHLRRICKYCLISYNSLSMKVNIPKSLRAPTLNQHARTTDSTANYKDVPYA